MEITHPIAYIPEHVNEIKTNKELISFFLFFYDLAIVYSFSVEKIKEIESVLTKEFLEVTKGKRLSNSKKWIVLSGILMRYFYRVERGISLPCQAITSVIEGCNKVSDETLIAEIINIDTIVKSHHSNEILTMRPSMLPLQFQNPNESFLYRLIEVREDVLGVFRESIPRKKINLTNIEGYLKFTPMKDMEYVYYSLFDILYGYISEVSKKNCLEFKTSLDESNHETINKFCESLLDFFNLFILDIELVRCLSEEITNVVFVEK